MAVFWVIVGVITDWTIQSNIGNRIMDMHMEPVLGIQDMHAVIPAGLIYFCSWICLMLGMLTLWSLLEVVLTMVLFPDIPLRPVMTAARGWMFMKM
jgi:hypothetical protein